MPNRTDSMISQTVGKAKGVKARLSGLVGDEFDRIIASRRAWMTGKTA